MRGPVAILLLLAAYAAVVSAVRVEVFGESQCDDTSLFLAQQLMPLWQNMSASLQVSVIPFGRANCTQNDTNDFLCYCVHSSDECAINEMMHCVIDQLPNVEQYLPILYCMQGLFDFANARKKCTLPAPMLDDDRLTTCSKGIQGRQLFGEAGKRTKALDPRLTGTPWIVIDGVHSKEARYNLLESVCNADQSACQTNSVSNPLHKLSYITIFAVCIRLLFNSE